MYLFCLFSRLFFFLSLGRYFPAVLLDFQSGSWSRCRLTSSSSRILDLRHAKATYLLDVFFLQRKLVSRPLLFYIAGKLFLLLGSRAETASFFVREEKGKEKERKEKRRRRKPRFHFYPWIIACSIPGAHDGFPCVMRCLECRYLRCANPKNSIAAPSLRKREPG